MKYRLLTNTILLFIIISLFSGCSKEDQESSLQNNSSINEISTSDTIDLTKLSPSVLYTEVYMINLDHQKYYGKTIIIKGNFNYYKDDQGENEYFAVLVSDDDGCCQQGFEFILNGDFKYPEDYPAENTEITISGVLEKYQEGETEFYHLANSSILSVG